MHMNKLIEGNKKFRTTTFSKYKEDFNSLVKDGQKPKILFIGCSDSRVAPNLVVNSVPGDLFMLRNIGNFVPPYSETNNNFHGSSAAIEYAVSVLKVKDIIVCGHTNCGACEALYDDTIKENPDLLHVSKWLELGKEAKENALLKFNDTNNKEELFKITEKVSIKYQLDNLLTYPAIQRKVKNKELSIHGWYYKIEDGEIEEYCTENDNFILLN
jgi:carbonic anhydrase